MRLSHCAGPVIQLITRKAVCMPRPPLWLSEPVKENMTGYLCAQFSVRYKNAAGINCDSLGSHPRRQHVAIASF